MSYSMKSSPNDEEPEEDIFFGLLEKTPEKWRWGARLAWVEGRGNRSVYIQIKIVNERGRHKGHMRNVKIVEVAFDSVRLNESLM